MHGGTCTSARLLGYHPESWYSCSCEAGPNVVCEGHARRVGAKRAEFGEDRYDIYDAHMQEGSMFCSGGTSLVHGHSKIRNDAGSCV